MTKPGAGTAPRGARDVSLAQKVAVLSAMAGVEQVVETHMAYVFLTASHAFKMKKPVSFGYFDHRSLAARHHACAEEMRLNWELAGDVYIGLMPLLRRADGALTLLGPGRVVDWLVSMKRLPADRMLDAVIEAGVGPAPGEVDGIVGKLADFFRKFQTRRPPRGLYLDHLRREQAVNAVNLREMAAHVPEIALAPLLDGLTARLDAAAPEITGREQARLILEGHGDLRPEHVCLTDPPVIFDRVETAREMRVIDVFDEVGYLGLECRLLGRADLHLRLLAGLAAAGFDPPSDTLQATYGVFRCVTRARLSLDHLRDPEPRTPEKWPVRARTYLHEALRLSGLSGVGVWP